jgi:LEA14-like dessication related protein
VEYETETSKVEVSETIYNATTDPVGYINATNYGHNGMDAVLIKVVYENGQEVSREEITQSSYRKTDTTIDVGTVMKNGNMSSAMLQAINTGDYNKIKANSQLYTCVSSFIRAINDFGSASKIEEYMKNYLMKYDEISAPGIREDKMRGIRSRIAGYLQPDERVILYDDNGLFIHGKTGTVITDKRTLLVEKKKVTNIHHSGIPYLLFEFSLGLPGVKLGEQYANSIGIFNSHFDLQGTAAALICALSFGDDPERPKIRLLSKC